MSLRGGCFSRRSNPLLNKQIWPLGYCFTRKARSFAITSLFQCVVVLHFYMEPKINIFKDLHDLSLAAARLFVQSSAQAIAGREVFWLRYRAATRLIRFIKSWPPRLIAIKSIGQRCTPSGAMNAVYRRMTRATVIIKRDLHYWITWTFQWITYTAYNRTSSLPPPQRIMRAH